MLARLLAAFIALAVIFGVVQASEHRAASAVAVELVDLDDSPDAALDAVIVEPVVVDALIAMHRTIEPPAVRQPVAVAFAPRTFRPPRS